MPKRRSGKEPIRPFTFTDDPPEVVRAKRYIRLIISIRRRFNG